MRALYEFACPRCGRQETFAAIGASEAPCPACGAASPRRFSVPVTDCRSFGRDSFTTRTLPVHRKPQDEMQEERIRDYQRRDGVKAQFGAGKTTGS